MDAATMRIRLFSTDLDGTLLGNPAAAWRFSVAWQALPAARRPLLVYNTGRSVADTRALIPARQLPRPDFIIGNVGTELHHAHFDWTEDFEARLAVNWSAERATAIVGAIAGVRRQPGPDGAHRFKSSWFWAKARPEELLELDARLHSADLAARVIYSCRYFLDVVPHEGGKGPALAWLSDRLGIPLHDVLVAGDTANDAAMFSVPSVRGIVVGNALPELITMTDPARTYLAQQTMADGVLEGLAHFGVLTPELATAATR